MATVTKYDVISPDGFSISFDKTWDTPEQAKEALAKWVKNYESQGFYSTSNRERIPLDKLAECCTIRPIEIEAEDLYSEQLYSAIGMAEGRLSTGAYPKDVFNWLREDVDKILKGEIIYD